MFLHVVYVSVYMFCACKINYSPLYMSSVPWSTVCVLVSVCVSLVMCCVIVHIHVCVHL